MIASPIFRARGHLSKITMRNLLMRGSGVVINDCLERHGWGRSDPVATTVVTLEPESRIVRGVRFETRGNGPEVKFKMSDLWSVVTENIEVRIKFDDFSIFPWVTTGEKRNQREWLDSSDLDVDFVHSERGSIPLTELQDVDGFSISFTLLPVRHDKVFLYGGIIPMSKENLLARLREAEVERSSPAIPTVALKLWFSKGKLQNALPLT